MMNFRALFATSSQIFIHYGDNSCSRIDHDSESLQVLKIDFNKSISKKFILPGMGFLFHRVD